MTVRVIPGNALDELRKLPSESVHCVVTSPPYLGLRSYRIEPVTWGGTEGCAHEWGAERIIKDTRGLAGSMLDGRQPSGQCDRLNGSSQGQWCQLCGAWRGHLGLEPSIDLFIDHLVSIFREVKRVLRSDGLCWVNLGDSYAGGGRGTVAEGAGSKQATNGGAVSGAMQNCVPDGLKPLDLCGIPERFALAMQADGWYWRDRIAWVKNSPMPESVSGWTWQKCKVKTEKGIITRRGDPSETGNTVGIMLGGGNTATADRGLAQWADCPGCDKCKDAGGYVLRKGSWRTTRAWEYIFMFAKTPDYFACQEQVREEQAESTLRSPNRKQSPRSITSDRKEVLSSYHTEQRDVGGRNPRSWWLINSEPALWDFCLACGTWYGKGGWNRKSVKRWSETETEDGEPKTVHHARCPNCQAVDQFVAHYALFPTDLPKRCIQAATSDAGVCPTCGSQWAPVVESPKGGASGQAWLDHANDAERGNRKTASSNGYSSSKVLSYRATCQCEAHKPIPATVLDPFSGGASSGLAADRLGRSYIGIELSESYLALSKARLQADGPMMAGMEE